MQKKLILSLACALALATLIGCGSSSESTSETSSSTSTTETNSASSDQSDTNTTSTNSTDSSSTSSLFTYSSHEESGDSSWESADAQSITLNGTSIQSNGSGVSISGTTATITQGGTYLVTGTLNDGNIIVECEESVKIVLDTVDITSSTTAPIFIKSAKKAVIILASESVNTLSDASNYLYASSDEDEPSATIFSKDDLSIYGEGTLTIKANYNDAIKSKDGLLLNSNISITSVDDGIIGKDYLVVTGGSYSINASGDGLKSSNDEESSLGYILIEDGSFDIVANNDALQSETNLKITTGAFNLITGGGSSATIGSDDSAKGLKVGADLLIDGGIFSINSADDTLHANSDMTINSGELSLASGDDGIHSDGNLTINDATINITQSYEGIEGATITINGGDIKVVASDDGINIAGGTNSATTATGGRPTKDSFSQVSGDYYLNITNGRIVVDANGDGIDVNGNMEMSGGVVLVNGPTENKNGAIDYDGTFTISGGVLVAAGSLGMAQSPSSSSSQSSLLVSFNSLLSANTMVHVEDSSGNNLLSFVPTKEYQSLVYSSTQLTSGSSYRVYYGGNDSGNQEEGLYTEGSYTAGTYYGSVVAN